MIKPIKLIKIDTHINVVDFLKKGSYALVRLCAVVHRCDLVRRCDHVVQGSHFQVLVLF